MHYEDRITSELFDDEQARLRHRRQDAETLIARLNLGYQDAADTLNLALEIIGEDLHDLYQRADNNIRRLLNQALFKALYICDEAVATAEMTGPLAAMHDLRDAIHQLPSNTPYSTPASATSTPTNAKAPLPNREWEHLDRVCLINGGSGLV